MSHSRAGEVDEWTAPLILVCYSGSLVSQYRRMKISTENPATNQSGFEADDLKRDADVEPSTAENLLT